MSAAELRTAAETLRAKVQEATKPESMHPWGDKSLPSLPPEMHAQEVAAYLGGTWGRYYASMHPGVGLALAGVLNAASIGMDSTSYGEGDLSCTELKLLGLARLINGGAA